MTMKKELKYGEPVLTEDQCALLQTLVPKPFEDLPIKPVESTALQNRGRRRGHARMAEAEVRVCSCQESEVM
jgi:hypothetical protein